MPKAALWLLGEDLDSGVAGVSARLPGHWMRAALRNQLVAFMLRFIVRLKILGNGFQVTWCVGCRRGPVRAAG